MSQCQWCRINKHFASIDFLDWNFATFWCCHPLSLFFDVFWDFFAFRPHLFCRFLPATEHTCTYIVKFRCISSLISPLILSVCGHLLIGKNVATLYYHSILYLDSLWLKTLRIATCNQLHMFTTWVLRSDDDLVHNSTEIIYSFNSYAHIIM